MIFIQANSSGNYNINKFVAEKGEKNNMLHIYKHALISIPFDL